MDDHSTSARAPELDGSDPLAVHRDRFVKAESDLVYFDGNSLGQPLRATARSVLRALPGDPQDPPRRRVEHTGRRTPRG